MYDEDDIKINGNRYFNNSKSFVSFKSIDEVLEKCKTVIDKWDQYEIEIKHEIFDHKIDLNNLSYEDFVYKYGPITHYFDNESGESSYYSHLDNFGGELIYPEDFRKTTNKFEYGDICLIRQEDKEWYGVIYRTPSSIYNLFGKEDPWFERGYFIEGVNADCIWDFDHVSESDIELAETIPEIYREFLELISKLFKLDIQEECFNLDMVDKMYYEYTEKTEKWKKYRDRCLEKIKEKENK